MTNNKYLWIKYHDKIYGSMWNSRVLLARKPGNAFWRCEKNQREFLINFAFRKGIKWNQPNEWSSVSKKDIKQEGGSSLFTYHNTFWSLLKNTFPELHWCPFTTKVRLPPAYWTDKTHQRHFCDQLAKRLNLDSSKPHHWKQISASQFAEYGGQGLLNQYSSIGDALLQIYPEYQWNITDIRETVPLGYWKLKENQIQFFHKLWNQLNPSNNEAFDCTKISQEDVSKNGGVSLLKQYNSYYDCIATLFPHQHDLPAWIKSQRQLPKDFWKHPKNQLLFLQYVKQELGIKQGSDWKKVTHNDIITLGGAGLLRQFSSLYECIKTHFPDEDLCLLRFSKAPVGWWDDLNNQKSFLDDFAKENDLSTPDDWAKVKKEKIVQRGGGALFEKYMSLYNILSNVYPSEQWIISRVRKPFSFWNVLKNQENFFLAVKEKLELSDVRELITLTNYQIACFGGSALLRRYSSLRNCLLHVFPLCDWNEWEDRRLIIGDYWTNIDNQRKFLNYFAQKNGIETPQQWKDVTAHDIAKAGGSGLLRVYPTWADALQTVFNFNPQESKEFRRRVPYNYWKQKENILRFVRECEKKFYITEAKHWYRISLKNIYTVDGGYSLIKSLGLLKVLEIVYPEEKWNKAQLHRHDKRSEQWKLFQMVRELFPDEEVIEEYKHAELARDSGFRVEFDIYLPYRKIAIEYQGEHHYNDLPAFGPSELYQIRDEEKKNLCKAYNINLVIVPYWFDGGKQDLYLLIQNVCPLL